MTSDEFENLWNYFLVLDEDLSSTTKYVEPKQKSVYSFEFQKIIILSCCEVETAFKELCTIIRGDHDFSSDIGEYKSIILKKFPLIIEATVTIGRTGERLKPFEGWDIKKLDWWDVYQQIKHNRISGFENATYNNAQTALSALYILILYISKSENFRTYSRYSKYITSEYTAQALYANADRPLPDFLSR